MKAAQERFGSRAAYARMEQAGGWAQAITPELAACIAERDSLYLGTANADGHQVLHTQRENLMKTDRHPLYAEATITCSCGTILYTRSTVPEQRVSVCSQCHPYFGGRHKRADTVGRIDAFQQKYGDVRRFAC